MDELDKALIFHLIYYSGKADGGNIFYVKNMPLRVPRHTRRYRSFFMVLIMKTPRRCGKRIRRGLSRG